MTVDVELVPADDELPYLTELLTRNELPTGDVEGKLGYFYVAVAADERIGIGGIEPCGEIGLLRSVVIETPYRGKGYGSMLCDELEATAAAQGLRALYLLTTTADAFFDARGYESIDRASAPTSIQQTEEFSDYCPGSATCMSKRLD